MASYPPPPYSPGFDPKVQRRMMKDQMRMQREQMRMQKRAMRRGSIVGPLLLVALGVMFLLIETGRLSWWPMMAWLGHWWPLLLIISGVLLLIEWAFDQHVQQTRAAQGLPPVGSRRIGGGVIWLLILVAILGGIAHGTARTMQWGADNFHFGLGDFDRALGEPHDSDDSMSHAIAADGTLTIDNPQGDVTVTGASDDGQMHIAIHKQVFAFKSRDAENKAEQLQPTINGADGRLTVNVPSIRGAHANLTIDVPRGVAVTVTTDHGDVNVSSVHAAVTVNANHGEVELSGLTGPVWAHMHNDNASFSAHSVTGEVTLDGRAGDINVSDIHGNVALTGAFSGSTHLERVNGGVHFQTHRTDFQLARLDGALDLDTGSDLSADQLMGPVVLKTSDRNITLERVQGNVQVVNSNGSVTTTSASPLGSIDVTNRRGSVDVGVPDAAGFQVHASTRHGEIENDFSLVKQGSDDSPQLTGMVGRGGPLVHIETADGDVTVRKSTVDPLPVAAPAPVMITAAPPAVPAVPKVPRAPKAPTPPKAPKAKMSTPVPAAVAPVDPKPTKD